VTKVLLVARNNEKKSDVFKRHECNKCTVDIVNAMEIPESRKQDEKINEGCKRVMRTMASKVT
jgi:hypothetical protein